MGNNPALTESKVTAPTGSPEDVLAPGVPAGFPGNKNDDDGRALDDYFEAADSGPQEYMGVIPPVSELVVPKSNRLITNQIVFQAGDVMAQQLFPADENRTSITMSAYRADNGAVAGWLFAGEQFAVNGIDGTFPAVIPARAQYYIAMPNVSFTFSPLDGYTGPIWVLPFTPQFNIAVQGIAVTC